MERFKVVIQKPTVSGANGVDSFNGRTGVVLPVSGDYTTGQVLEVTDKKYVTDAEKVVIGNTSNTNTGDQKTVENFPTEETGAFTVADDSDRAWIECNFTVETEVTITADSVGVIGEPVYFSVKGDGQIKFIEDGITIDLNAGQSLILGSKGDKIALMKTGALTYEIV